MEIAVEVFHRRPQSPPLIKGKLWLAPKRADENLPRAVLLVHRQGRSKEDWNAFAPALVNAGLTTLAIDLRGKGDAGEKSLIEDIQSAVVFLKISEKVKAGRIVIIGANVGGTGAAHYASANKQMANIVDGLVILSPEEEYKKVIFFEPLKAIVGIPVLLVASKSDKRAAKTVEKAKALCRTECTARVYPTGGSGSELLKSAKGPALRDVLEFVARPRG